MAAIRERDGLDWKFEAEERSREVAKLSKRIAELEAALEPFAASARMMSEAERTDEDVAALVLGTDLTPSDFWTAMHVMTKSD